MTTKVDHTHVPGCDCSPCRHDETMIVDGHCYLCAQPWARFEIWHRTTVGSAESRGFVSRHLGARATQEELVRLCEADESDTERRTTIDYAIVRAGEEPDGSDYGVTPSNCPVGSCLGWTGDHRLLSATVSAPDGYSDYVPRRLAFERAAMFRYTSAGRQYHYGPVARYDRVYRHEPDIAEMAAYYESLGSTRVEGYVLAGQGGTAFDGFFEGSLDDALSLAVESAYAVMVYHHCAEVVIAHAGAELCAVVCDLPFTVPERAAEARLAAQNARN